MTNTILEKKFTYNNSINKIPTVAILEDMPLIREEIEQFIKNELGWQVIIAENRQEAVKYCEEQKAEFYILDIKLGNDKEKSQEGIDTAEEIKGIDSNVFVSIFSDHSQSQKFQQRAKKVGVNYFEPKSSPVQEGLSRIAIKMLIFQKNLLDSIFQKYLDSSAYLDNDEILKIVNKIKEVNKKLEDIKKIERIYQFDSTGHPILDKPKDNEKVLNPAFSPVEEDENIPIDEDENIREYESRKQDSEWREKYQNQYVAFADGNWLPEFIANDQEVLFEQLDHSEIYKDKPIFYAKLEKLDKVKESKNLPKLSRAAQFRAFKKIKN
jgi:DNA-binding NarL/FixJ family response regulator